MTGPNRFDTVVATELMERIVILVWRETVAETVIELRLEGAEGVGKTT